MESSFSFPLCFHWSTYTIMLGRAFQNLDSVMKKWEYISVSIVYYKESNVYVIVLAESLLTSYLMEQAWAGFWKSFGKYPCCILWMGHAVDVGQLWWRE